MSEPVRPALTPEEWADALAWPWGLRDFIVRPAEMIGYGDDSPDDLHRVAALALHDQPFGFEWSDVDDLMFLAGQLSDGTPYVAGKLKRLAARIAALLPPRETP